MAQSLAKILVHLIFSTKRRRALLPNSPFAELHAFARGVLDEQKCHLVE